MVPEILLADHVPNDVIDDVVGAAAWYLNDSWMQAFQSGTASDFLNAVEQWALTIEFPPHLITPRRILLGKQQPSFCEAVTETVRRLRFLETFSRDFPPQVLAEIVGGSMNYGRFYTIRGGEYPSDIDIFLIVDPDFFDTSGESGLLFSQEKGFSESQQQAFQLRCRRFADLYRSGSAEYMYHKIPIHGFPLSLKIFPQEVFQWEFGVLPQELIAKMENREAMIRGYKAAPSVDPVSEQKSFFGDIHTVPCVDVQLPDGEVISGLIAGIFWDGFFFTGEHHNHLLPNVTVAYDPGNHVKPVLGTFLEQLRREFAREMEMADNKKTIDYIHVIDRSPIMSPQVMVEAREKFFS